MESRRERRGVLSTFLELPGHGLGAMSQLTVLENREMLIEGVKGIAEYGEGQVRLNLGNFGLRIGGRSLELRCMSAGCVSVSGCLQSIEFLT